MAHDVFISYSSQDKPIADAICAWLEAAKIRCWIAPRDVLPGVPYGEALSEALRASQVLLLVFSSNSNRSGQVMREVESAVDKGIPILPVRIEDVKPSASLDFFVKAIHWLDAITPPLEKHLQTLAGTIRLLLERQDPGAVAPGTAGLTKSVPTPAGSEPIAPAIEMPKKTSPGSKTPRGSSVPMRVLSWLLAGLGLAFVVFMVWEIARPPANDSAKSRGGPREKKKIDKEKINEAKGPLPGKLLYGPVSGKLVAKPGGPAPMKTAGLAIRDCVVEATFINPALPVGVCSWREELYFRMAPDSPKSESWGIGIENMGFWASFRWSEKAEFISGEHGKLPEGLLAPKKGKRNRLKLVLDGNQGRFFVNGRYVADFDASPIMSQGDVAAGLNFDFIEGKWQQPFETHFEDFRVSELGPGDSLGLNLDGGITMPFLPIPKGSFWMGWRSENQQSQQVTIGADFELSTYPVTQEQWQAIMGNNPSYFSREGGGKEKVANISAADLKRFPVESVSWDGVQQFLTKLNAREKGKGWLYRLPKEAEWEYACRNAAASEKECSFDFYFDKGTNDLSSQQANFNGEQPAGKADKGPFLGRSAKVGSYAANQLGFYDMHGNVLQWCDDRWGDGERILRGGCWMNDGHDLRAAAPFHSAPTFQAYHTGFRLVRVPLAK